MEQVSQELLATRRHAKAPPGPPASKPEVKSRLRRSLRFFFYAWIAITSFLLILVAKLPQEKIGHYCLDQLSQNTSYYWNAKNVSFGLLFSPYIKLSGLDLRPKTAIARGAIQIDELVLHPDLWQMLPIPGIKAFTPAASFSLEAFQGSGSGYFLSSTEAMEIKLSGTNFVIDKMHFLKDNYDYDIKGTIKDISLRLSSSGKWTKSNGDFAVAMTGFAFDPASLQLGFPLPILDIGPAMIKAQINQGRVALGGSSLGAAGRDLELNLDGGLNLKEPMDFTELDLRLKLKFAERITKVLPAIESALKSFKRPDGFYGLKFNGSLAAPGWPSLYSN